MAGKRTQQERLVEALIQRGARIVTDRAPAETDRYIKLTGPGNSGFWFVGKAGALRCGRNASTSRAVSEHLKAKLLEEVPQ